MHETQCYDVGDDVDGVEEAKDEEKTIDAEGVEVAFEAAPTDDAVAPAQTPFAEPPFDEPPYDEPAATPFDEPAATPFEAAAAPLTQTTPFDEPISPSDEPTSPFDEPTTPTAPIQPLAEVPTPCQRDSEIARQLHEEDARELEEARMRDAALAAELFENDEREVAERRRLAATRDEALAAELLEEEERTALRKQADEALSAAAAARIASEMADAERVLEARSADDAAVARRLAGQAYTRPTRGSSDEAYARAVALALEDEEEEDEAQTRDDALLAQALHHQEEDDSERAPRRRGDVEDADLALAITLDEEEAADHARRRRAGSDDLALAITLTEEDTARHDAGSDDEMLARALQCQEDDHGRNAALARRLEEDATLETVRALQSQEDGRGYDDEAFARRLEEDANLEAVRRITQRDQRNDTQLAFELQQQQHETARRAENDFSVAARVQRELGAQEEDEVLRRRRLELEPPSRLTRPVEAGPTENRKERRARQLLKEARAIEAQAARSLGRDLSLDELGDQAARDIDTGATVGAPTSAARAIAAQRGYVDPTDADQALGRAADAERLAADRTFASRRDVQARASRRPDDPHRLRAEALGKRARKQSDRAAGLYFAANNGHLLRAARDVERARNLGLEGVLNEVLTHLATALANGERIQIDLHWLSRPVWKTTSERPS